MAFISGPTLAQYMRRHGPLVEPVAVALGKAIANALAYAHDNEVIHCDLKPGNVMVQWDGTTVIPQVVDFGLSVVDQRDDRGAVTAVHRVAGTPQYMAPEQVKGRQLSGACDVYALGQMLWEMLMGRPAFAGDQWEIMQQKAEVTQGLRLHKAPFNTSQEIATIIEACTQPDPRKRPTARQVYERLAAMQTAMKTTSAPALVGPAPMSFDAGVQDTPSSWFDSRGVVSGVSTAYESKVLARSDGQGSFLQFQGLRAGSNEFGSLMQRCPAAPFVGQVLRFEGMVRTKDVPQWAGLWLRVDGAQGELFFDNMHDRPLRGSTQWRHCVIDVSVPAGALWLNYGIVLMGSGTVWADQLQLSVRVSEGRWWPISLWDAGGY